MINEIKERISEPLNPFWKKVQIFGAVLGGVGALIVAYPFTLPVVISASGTYLVTIGATIASISQLTKK